MSLLSFTRRAGLLVASAAAPLAAQVTPTASEIVARHVQAIGGADAIRAITSVRQTGTLAMPAMGLGGETEVLFALPNRSSTRVTIGGLGEMLVGTDGQVAWSVNPMQGPRLMTDQELAATKEGADFLAQMLLPADHFTRIEVVGRTDFAGEPTWALTFVSKATGVVTQRYFSVATGLLRGAEATSETAMGSVASRSTFADYKAFHGILFPTKTETAVGPQTMVMTTTAVEFNRLPADAIAIPDAVKPLIGK